MASSSSSRGCSSASRRVVAIAMAQTRQIRTSFYNTAYNIKIYISKMAKQRKKKNQAAIVLLCLFVVDDRWRPTEIGDAIKVKYPPYTIVIEKLFIA